MRQNHLYRKRFAVPLTLAPSFPGGEYRLSRRPVTNDTELGRIDDCTTDLPYGRWHHPGRPQGAAPTNRRTGFAVGAGPCACPAANGTTLGGHRGPPLQTHAQGLP